MLKDISPPAAEPITLSETKLFLRVDHEDEDSLIETLIKSARDRLEAHLGIAMITRPMETAGPAQTCIRLPRWPVISVDSVLTDGIEIFDYDANLRSQPARVTIDLANRSIDGIDVQFTAGFGSDPVDVPTPLRHAMLLLVSHAMSIGTWRRRRYR